MPEPDAFETEERLVEVAGGALFSQRVAPPVVADAAPILLFHDSLGAVALWRTFPAKLSRAAGRPVLAYDRLGFGRSSPRGDRMSFDFVAKEATEAIGPLLDAWKVDRFVAFGHSVGGGMAVETAARHQTRVEALVTVSAQAFVEDRTIEGLEAARRAFADPEQIARLAKYHGDKASWVVEAWLGTWLAPEFAEWTLDSALARVVCPTFAVHGAEDEYGSAAHPERIAAGAHGHALILPGIGHVPHRECPETLAGATARFLADPGRAPTIVEPT